MAIAISILALVLGVIAASPAIKRWYDLYTVPRKAATMHEWLYLLKRGKITTSFRGETNPPEQMNVAIHLWYEYRRLCKHRVETDPGTLEETLKIFQKENRRYVNTKDLEPFIGATREKPRQSAPPGVFDYEMARYYGLEYSDIASNQISHRYTDESGRETHAFRERNAEELECARSTLQKWLDANNAEATAKVIYQTTEVGIPHEEK